MEIEILNLGHDRTCLQDPSVVYVGRQMESLCLHASPLQNPYKVGRDGDRNTVCELNLTQVLNPAMDTRTGPVWDELHRLAQRVVSGKPLKLACWCAPERCHAFDVAAAVRAIATELIQPRPFQVGDKVRLRFAPAVGYQIVRILSTPMGERSTHLQPPEGMFQCLYELKPLAGDFKAWWYHTQLEPWMELVDPPAKCDRPPVHAPVNRPLERVTGRVRVLPPLPKPEEQLDLLGGAV